jgi:coatomer subunit gamma
MDKNQAISSSALLSGIYMIKGNSEFVKKWTNEIVERLNSKYQ